MGKRVFDMVVGTILCVLALPVILALAMTSAALLRAWPLFFQERVGRGGRTFRVIKIRTLPPGTPAYMLKTELGDLTERIPAVLRFLRRSHIDEIPQLLLVPLGRLSLVGPRPKMPDDVEPVDAGYRTARLQVAQGCTGLWQIGRHAGDLPHEAPQYDYFYLRYGTLLLDAWVLWRTFLLMTRLGPPVGLDRIPVWALRSGVAAAIVPGATVPTSLLKHVEAA